MQVTRLFHTIVRDGGATVTSKLVRVKKQTGFFVSLWGAGNVLDLIDFTPESLTEGLNTLNPYILEGRFVGIWIDKSHGKVYIDISEWVQDREQAIQRGVYEHQAAIWDIEKNQEIYLQSGIRLF